MKVTFPATVYWPMKAFVYANFVFGVLAPQWKEDMAAYI